MLRQDMGMTSAMRKTIKIHWIKTRNLAKKKRSSTISFRSCSWQRRHKIGRNLQFRKSFLEVLQWKPSSPQLQSLPEKNDSIIR